MLATRLHAGGCLGVLQWHRGAQRTQRACRARRGACAVLCEKALAVCEGGSVAA